MVFTPSALQQSLPLTARRLWVGLSGGLDSVVLLHALTQLKLAVPILALHINHQISPNAFRWQEHCAETCGAWGIEFITERVVVERRGRGLEDAAREARYAVFEKYVREGDYLLTAHHADDQSETILLRLMRGSGPRGLAAISRQRPLGAGSLLRPLLEFTRAELEFYAIAQNLQWVEDESNTDTQYDRNYLRQNVMPLLSARWPEFNRRWQQSAQACAESETLLAELAIEDLARANPRAERLGQSLMHSVIGELSIARRHNLLRHWFRQQQYATPELIHLQQIDTQLIHGRGDAEGDVRWGDVVMHRFRDRLYVLPLQFLAALRPNADPRPVILPNKTCVADTSAGALIFEYVPHVYTLGCLRADIEQVELRWRMGGERCQPEGRRHSQTLKKLLQEYDVEPWWRDRVPLVFVGEQLAAVGDLWICAGFAALPGAPGYRLRWRLP